MKNENWSIQKMREERILSTLKNTYRNSDQNTDEKHMENPDENNQSTLSLFLNRFKLLLEEA